MRNIALALSALALTSASAAADCTSEVNDAFAKLRKSAAFRMETKIANSAGTLSMSNDYVLPNRMHQSVTIETGAPGKMEMILVDGKAWSNQANAGWAEVPADFANKIAKQMQETVVDAPKDESKYECLGDVTLDGKTYTGYRTVRDQQKTDGSNGTEKAIQTVYVDKDLGIPARNIVTLEKAPDKRIFDGTFSLQEGLKIEPPKL